MRAVTTQQELQDNVDQLIRYLNSGNVDEVAYAKDLVRRGICFILYNQNDSTFFLPSRFVGYAHNTRERHEANAQKHGGVTNPAISKLIGSDPEPDDNLDGAYLQFCSRLDIDANRRGSFGVLRKFWVLR
jgi:hypothetical protein